MSKLLKTRNINIKIISFAKCFVIFVIIFTFPFTINASGPTEGLGEVYIFIVLIISSFLTILFFRTLGSLKAIEKIISLEVKILPKFSTKFFIFSLPIILFLTFVVFLLNDSSIQSIFLNLLGKTLFFLPVYALPLILIFRLFIIPFKFHKLFLYYKLIHFLLVVIFISTIISAANPAYFFISSRYSVFFSYLKCKYIKITAQCAYQTATRNTEGGNEKFCLSLPEIGYYDEELNKPIDRNSCLIEVAKKKKDESICGNITTGFRDPMENLKDCYFAVGKNLDNNPSLCGQSRDVKTKEECYLSLAGSLKRVSLCDEIKDSVKKNECLKVAAVSTKEGNLCDKVENNLKVSCYIDIAETTRNESFCNKITELDSKDYCYYKVAEHSNNGSLCETIQGLKWKNTCYYHTASGKKEISWCDKIKNNLELKGGCYADIAVRTNNELLCNKITTSDKKDLCYYGVGVKKGDELLCTKIQSINLKKECIYRITGINSWL